MAQIIVRNIQDDVKERLRARAQAHGRSLEAEVRDILNEAAGPPGYDEMIGLGTEIANAFAGIGMTPREYELFEMAIAELRAQRPRVVKFDK
jgi:plasmid stability protein